MKEKPVRQIHLLAAVIGTLVFSFGGAAEVLAEQVKLEEVHICCGMCVKKINNVLGKADGVSSVTVLQGERTVKFEAKNAAAVQTGLKTLYDAGFYGKSSQKGPDLSITDAKKNQVDLSGMHLCCAGCTRAVEAALKEVSGVKGISIQAKEGIVTVTGDNVSLAETLKALHNAGFHGTVK
ncbi:MAG TPA: cation transporter [Planctomicrobium sp.]|nr:cation transporter [Planctomicrobium sp.]